MDDLWFLADEAEQAAEQAAHELGRRHDDYLEPSLTRVVSRPHFRRAVTRGKDSGAPYGVHTIVYRECGDLLLVRHEHVEKWVLPGGAVDGGESFRETAARELAEEAGVEVTFDGLGMLVEVDIRCDGHDVWGVIPVYAARARTFEPDVNDPDDEITDAKWFDDLPPDTRDRAILQEWREQYLS